MKDVKLYPTVQDRSQRGVALITALFVLMILSTISAAILISATSETKMGGIARNSERALKLAETGVQIARATIEEGAVSGSLASVDGFVDGGYFFTSMGSGMPGNEKWEQWHYDSGISGNNIQSEISTPLRAVWMKEAPGRNGSWSGSSFYLNNIFSIIAGGAYFPIEFDTDTDIRAVDEYTGREGVDYDPDGILNWTGDADGNKSVGEGSRSNTGFNNDYAVRMSPMGSYSNISTIPGENPRIVQQTVYFSYSGVPDGGSASTSTDTQSTVRLRAINALCNNSDHSNSSSDDTKVNALWEFDTGIHGVGTAPAVFDPSPNQPGDEIIYFAVAGLGDANIRSRSSMSNNPNSYDDQDENIYIFAVVDDTNSLATNAGLGECSKTGSYRLKWAHPFPDPDVNEWTDYPPEEATGTNGMFPPYTRVAADITPLLPEDDVLFDYRGSRRDDNRQNHVRGNLYMVFDPHSVSPVILKVLYPLDGLDLNGAKMVTDQREKTLDGVPNDPDDQSSLLVYGDPADPQIEIYLAFAAHSKVKDREMSTSRNWGREFDLKKYDNVQSRVISLRDRLDGACDSDGKNCSWNWDSAKSRFPTFKWSYRLPSRDPHRGDPRPWNGYGEFVWETWFEQQVAPMLGVSDIDQDGRIWSAVTNADGDPKGGQRSLYSMIYPAYESLGYTDGSAYNNSLNPPTTGNGAPVAFDTSEDWDVSHLMIMGIRDTWDDYMEGHQTNPMWDDMVTDPVSDLTPLNPFAMPVKSNPVESYWTHKHDSNPAMGPKYILAEDNGAMPQEFYPDSTESVITYTAGESNNWAGNADKIGFDRPYVWSEDLWQDNVRGNPVRGLDMQGWADSGLSTNRNSNDLDVEGETSAFCRECLDGDGLIVTVFNHDIGGPNIEDLRMHAVNATTGKHSWDYHMPATLAGDYFNATPAIANGLVFVAYASRNGNQQGAILRALNADTGESKQSILFDQDNNSISAFDGNRAYRADALLLPPTIANGALYVGTYHFRGTSSPDNDSIRIYAFSPVFRMFSMGVYPMEPTSLGTIPDLTAPPGVGANLGARAERKLQVWITGAGSKWEEIRESQQ